MSSRELGPSSHTSSRKRARADLQPLPATTLPGELRARLEARVQTLDAALVQLRGSRVAGEKGDPAHPPSAVLVAGPLASAGYDVDQARSFALSQALHARRMRRGLLHGLEVLTPATANAAKEARDSRAATNAEKRHQAARAAAAAFGAKDTLASASASASVLNAVLGALEPGA
jgi:hypothetical protein